MLFVKIMIILKLMESIVTSGSNQSPELYNEENFSPAVRNTELQEWLLCGTQPHMPKLIDLRGV